MIDDDSLDMQHFTEQEWLDTWSKILSGLELTRAALLDSEINLTDVQVANLDGEAAMLRRVLESRGVVLDE